MLLALAAPPGLAWAQVEESGRVPEGNAWVVWLVLAVITVPALVVLFLNPHRENEV